MAIPDDLELIQRMARDRDAAAFSDLYDRHAPMVFGLACRMLGRKEEAEDLLQEVFLSAWDRAASYNGARGAVAAWILVMARSRCLDRLRRRALRQDKEQSLYAEDEDGNEFSSIAEPGVPVLEGLANDERRVEVGRALALLPAPQRSVLEAAYFGGLSQQEIADKTGEPLGTVKTRMRLGMMKLAELLSAAEKL